MQQQVSDNRSGFMTLITVLIVAVVGLSIAMSVITTGVIQTKTSITVIQSQQTKALANTCAEIALRQIALNNSYTGTGNQTLGNGSCTYTVTAADLTNKNIQATGTVQNTVRKVLITNVRFSVPQAKLIYDSWQEVADF
ncbi:MAG: hypothetical protein ACEQSA_01995 [Weeksellaceae bacterium]